MAENNTRQPRSSSENKVRKKVLTWHIHGNYLYYLTQSPHDFYLPVKPGLPEGYGGRAGTLPWGDNVFEVPAEEVRTQKFDIILFQSHRNYLEDQYEILSDEQHKLPKVYLEHDPPRENPTDTRHPVDDPNMLIVHVTHFNDLMWDSGKTPTTVVEHGVLVPEDVHYTGELNCGIVVVNNLGRRGRRLGTDVYQNIRQEVPLDLVGMNSKEMGGLGELPHHELLKFESRYRFFFNPIRYTSLGLAVCEAMMIGMPVIGLATTEMAAVVENGVSGYVDTNVEQLKDDMKELIQHPAAARALSEGAARYARENFNIQRFARDWDAVFSQF